MKWVEALKEYAKTTGKFVVPKKGSAEYEAVKKMMGGAAHSATGASAPIKAHGAPAELKAPRKRKAAAKKAEPVSADPAMEALEKERKPRKPRAKKQGTSELLGATGADVAASKNPEVLLNNAANTHERVAPPAALAGDMKAMKAAVARVRKPKALPKLVEAEKVENETPFSVQALRRKLGA
jgi:hypothetical protein